MKSARVVIFLTSSVLFAGPATAVPVPRDSLSLVARKIGASLETRQLEPVVDSVNTVGGLAAPVVKAAEDVAGPIVKRQNETTTDPASNPPTDIITTASDVVGGIGILKSRQDDAITGLTGTVGSVAAPVVQAAEGPILKRHNESATNILSDPVGSVISTVGEVVGGTGILRARQDSALSDSVVNDATSDATPATSLLSRQNPSSLPTTASTPASTPSNVSSSTSNSPAPNPISGVVDTAGGVAGPIVQVAEGAAGTVVGGALKRDEPCEV